MERGSKYVLSTIQILIMATSSISMHYFTPNLASSSVFFSFFFLNFLLSLFKIYLLLTFYLFYLVFRDGLVPVSRYSPPLT